MWCTLPRQAHTFEVGALLDRSSARATLHFTRGGASLHGQTMPLDRHDDSAPAAAPWVHTHGGGVQGASAMQKKPKYGVLGGRMYVRVSAVYPRVPRILGHRPVHDNDILTGGPLVLG